MTDIYWTAESSIHPNYTISLRAPNTTKPEEFQACLDLFILKFGPKLKSIPTVSRFYDGTFCAIIYFIGFPPDIDFVKMG